MRRAPEAGFEIALIGAPRRLQAAARTVWAALPPAIQIVLTRQWEPMCWPLISSVRDVTSGDQRVLACYDVDGERLLVDREAVARLPDDTLQAVLAHEIAHAYQIATDRPPDEAEAVALAAAWGFPLQWVPEIELVRAAWSRRRPATGVPGTGLSPAARIAGGRVTARRGVEARVAHAGRRFRA